MDKILFLKAIPLCSLTFPSQQHLGKVRPYKHTWCPHRVIPVSAQVCSKGPGALCGGNSSSHPCGRWLEQDPIYGAPHGHRKFWFFSLASFLRSLGVYSRLSPADFCGCKMGPRVVSFLCLHHTWLLRAQSPHGSEPQEKPDVGLVWELSLPWTSQQLRPSPARSCLSAVQELLQPKQPMRVYLGWEGEL